MLSLLPSVPLPCPARVCPPLSMCKWGTSVFQAEITAHHETLQGKLQELLCWVSGTAQALDGSDYQHTLDVSSLSRCLQRYQVTMAMPPILGDAPNPSLWMEMLFSVRRRSC